MGYCMLPPRPEEAEYHLLNFETGFGCFFFQQAFLFNREDLLFVIVNLFNKFTIL